jgi:hypothetical protein
VLSRVSQRKGFGEAVNPSGEWVPFDQATGIFGEFTDSALCRAIE